MPEEITESPIRGDELAAMRKMCTALDALDLRTRRRVMTWLVDRYAPDLDLWAGSATEGRESS